VGVKLYVEALDHAPPECRGSELVVLLVLCEDANDRTRQTWMGAEKLARRSRCTASTARGHLAKLEERKIIRRHESGAVADGARPVVAHRGHRTVIEVLPMAPGSRRLPTEKGARIPEERRQDPSAKAPGSRRPSPHAPAVPLILSAADVPADVIVEVREALRERTGRDVGDVWARRVAASLLVGRPGVTAPRPWIRAVIERETNLQRFLPVPDV
jgi:hypothetical protein